MNLSEIAVFAVEATALILLIIDLIVMISVVLEHRYSIFGFPFSKTTLSHVTKKVKTKRKYTTKHRKDN